MMNPVIDANANNNPFNNNYYSSVLPPLSGTTAKTEIPLLPATPAAAATNYNSLIGADQKTAVKSESCLTYNTVSRKRLRDSVHFPLLSYPPLQAATKNCGSLQIQQNLDIDRLISEHVSIIILHLKL